MCTHAVQVAMEPEGIYFHSGVWKLLKVAIKTINNEYLTVTAVV